MFKTGFEFFVRLPSSGNDRVLHPAIVEESSSEEIIALLKEEGLEVESELEVIIFYQIHDGFVQQPARITTLERDGATDIITLVATGDPISAEDRDCYRVTAISADADARVGAGAPCSLQDVSATGFAIVSNEVFAIGETLPVALRYEDTEYTGIGNIQSARDLGHNRTRYGLSFRNDDSDRPLLDGLNRVSLLIQRNQIARR